MFLINILIHYKLFNKVIFRKYDLIKYTPFHQNFKINK